MRTAECVLGRPPVEDPFAWMAEDSENTAAAVDETASLLDLE